jgi:hypothetical protein
MFTQVHDVEESKEDLKEQARIVSPQAAGSCENAMFMCEKCSKYFNLSTKKPVSLLCCHNTLCQPCYSSSFPNSSTFICPFGCSAHHSNSSRMTVTTPSYCQYLVKLMRRTGESAEVRCDAHPGRAVEYYDQEDRKYKCLECVIPEGVTKVTKKDIEETRNQLVKALKT